MGEGWVGARGCQKHEILLKIAVVAVGARSVRRLGSGVHRCLGRLCIATAGGGGRAEKHLWGWKQAATKKWPQQQPRGGGQQLLASAWEARRSSFHEEKQGCVRNKSSREAARRVSSTCMEHRLCSWHCTRPWRPWIE